jgi:carboxypeptidase Q
MTEPETVNVTSRNLVGEYFGSTLPEKLLGVTAHMDSWDVGQGAQDDGFGVIFGILMVRLFNDFALRPRRTIRAIFFTGEEIGEKGSRAYAEAHADEMHRFQGAFEADVGCEVNGLLFHGGQDLGCMLYEILKMIQPLIPNVTMAYREHWSSDIDNFMHHQVPTIGLRGGPRYRWFTHAEPDTMTSINSHQLDRCFALYAATAYVVANMNADLPRESQPKPTPPPPAGQRSGNQIGPIEQWPVVYYFPILVGLS